ncbi:MAG: hypothetical protein F4208_11925 [Gemmatimonadales bacterium]|nr:hypothetical protein [Gemmatimonadales bacterium]
MVPTVCVWAGFSLATGAVAAQQVIELPLEDRILEADFSEVYRVGNGDREWELFSYVSAVSFDARGNLHISDLVGDELRVVVVDPSGNLVAAFGRRGDGPGEFREANQAFALADGRTVVPDKGHFAYHVFDSEGAFERMVRFPGVGPSHDLPAGMTPSANPRIRRADRDGTVLDRVISGWDVQRQTNTPAGRLSIEPGPRQVARVEFEGEESREVPLFRASGSPDDRVKFHFAPLPNGRVAFSDSTAYAVRIVEPAGNVGRILTRPFPVRPWDKRNRRAFANSLRIRLEQESAESRDRAEMLGLFGGVQAVVARLDDLDLPGEVEIIDALDTDWEGRIWVLRTPADGFPDLDIVGTFQSAVGGRPNTLPPTRPGPVDLITAEGRYIGTLAEARMPAAFGPGGLVAYVELDAFDVPTVVVRRVSAAIRE